MVEFKNDILFMQTDKTPRPTEATKKLSSDESSRPKEEEIEGKSKVICANRYFMGLKRKKVEDFPKNGQNGNLKNSSSVSYLDSLDRSLLFSARASDNSCSNVLGFQLVGFLE